MARPTISIHERRLLAYRENRERLSNGKINCIPTPFSRIGTCFPGIQQQKYYLMTGNTKSAKTSLTNYLFVWYPVVYAYCYPDKLRVKIFYFSLEMSSGQLMDKLTCLWLYVKKQISISPNALNSIGDPLSEDILALLSSDDYHHFFSFLESHVTFIEDSKTPASIYNYCKAYALKHGKVFTRGGTVSEEDPFGIDAIFDHYVQDDPDEYRVIIVDHYGLLQRESGHTLRETIQSFSAHNCVDLRNSYNYTIVGVMQQNAEKQAGEAIKTNRLTPSVDGLAECKSVIQDVDMSLSIFSPWYFEKTSWEGYDIKTWRDSIRFMEVMINRNGPANSIIPLYFNGACGYFRQLPLPADPRLAEYQTKLLIS
jgi:hypothetical protein